VLIPSLKLLRRRFPEARITYIHDRQINKKWVLAASVLRDTGLVDQFMVYYVGDKKIMKAIALIHNLQLIGRLRLLPDSVFFNSNPCDQTLKRFFFKMFFAFCGFKHRFSLSKGDWPIVSKANDTWSYKTGYPCSILLRKLSCHLRTQ